MRLIFGKIKNLLGTKITDKPSAISIEKKTVTNKEIAKKESKPSTKTSSHQNLREKTHRENYEQDLKYHLYHQQLIYNDSYHPENYVRSKVLGYEQYHFRTDIQDGSLIVYDHDGQWELYGPNNLDHFWFIYDNGWQYAGELDQEVIAKKRNIYDYIIQQEYSEQQDHVSETKYETKSEVRSEAQSEAKPKKVNPKNKKIISKASVDQSSAINKPESVTVAEKSKTVKAPVKKAAAVKKSPVKKAAAKTKTTTKPKKPSTEKSE